MSAKSKISTTAALLAVAALTLTGCSASSGNTATASSSPAPTETAKILTPEEKAQAFTSLSNFMMSAEFAEVYAGPANSAGSMDVTDNKTINLMEDRLQLIYGGFPEVQQATFKWTEDEAQRISKALAPYLYDGFEAQFIESLRKHEGGLLLTTSSSLANNSNPRVVTADDGSTCALTDDPWSVGFNDAYLDVGPNVVREGHEPQRTTRLDYVTTFTIKCGDGNAMTFSQPKHLSFVDESGEWLIYEYGREATATVKIQPAS